MQALEQLLALGAVEHALVHQGRDALGRAGGGDALGQRQAAHAMDDGEDAGLLQVHGRALAAAAQQPDRKSTRLNSSHSQISYAVFCLKKKKKTNKCIKERQIRM